MSDTALRAAPGANGSTRSQQPAPPAAEPGNAAPVSEGSLAARFVALLTPVFAVAAGWLAGLVGRLIPGVHLDQTQIVVFMVAAATSALGSALKWLHGWQQHERLVAAGTASPVKAAKVVTAVTAVKAAQPVTATGGAA